MAKKNILAAILNTINQVQQKNKANVNEATADPTVFDLITGKLKQLDEKNKANRVQKGKSPESILDLIRQQIEGARTENQADSNVATAPKSVFDNILKEIDKRPKRQASTGLRKIVEDYNLDVNKLPRDVVGQIQEKYVADRKQFDKKYAQAMHDLIGKY